MRWLCWFWHRWREMGTKRCCLRCGEVQYLHLDYEWGPGYWAVPRPMYPRILYRRTTVAERLENGCELTSALVHDERERSAMGPEWYDTPAEALRS